MDAKGTSTAAVPSTRESSRAAPRAAFDRKDALSELIHISRTIGSDPDLVQGGGGNTSVKTRNGVKMLIKASGTALAAMDADQGWAELDLEQARAILDDRRLQRLPASRREREVLRRLSAAVLRPTGARPSVETNLHALLDRVVIHTHPVGINAFLCSRDSRQLYLEVLGTSFGEPLYVRYTDPGFTLAAHLRRSIEAFYRRTRRLPRMVYLENHGIFITAPEVEECLELTRAMARIGQLFVGGRTNPQSFQTLILKPPRTRAGGDGKGADRPSLGALRLRGALIRGGVAPGLLRRDDTAIAGEFAGHNKAVFAARQGAFTPDQIVYCRTHPLVLSRDAMSAGARKKAGARDAIAEEAAAYRKKYRVDPRVIIAPGEGVYYTAPDFEQLQVVGEVFRGAIATLLRTEKAGGPRFLSRDQAAFIAGWEVEAFRAQVASGARRRLTGKVAAVFDGGDTGACDAISGLREGGATVFLIGSRPPAESGGDRKLFHLACDPGEESSVEQAFAALAASAGGIDILALSLPSRSPRPLAEHTAKNWDELTARALKLGFFAIRTAARIFKEQGCRAEIQIPGGRRGEFPIPGSIERALRELWEEDLRPLKVVFIERPV